MGSLVLFAFEGTWSIEFVGISKDFPFVVFAKYLLIELNAVSAKSSLIEFDAGYFVRTKKILCLLLRPLSLIIIKKNPCFF